MRIDFHPEATQELADAADWYLRQSEQTARRFAVAIENALEKIEADPLRFAIVRADCRSCSAERFPYQVVFRVDPHRISIIAVAHAKRRPGYWHERVR